MKNDTVGVGQVTGMLAVSRLATVAAFSPAPATQTEWWSSAAYVITWCLLLIPNYLFTRYASVDWLKTAVRRHPLVGKTTVGLFGAWCVYVLGINAGQFIYFVRESLSPDMSAATLCVVLLVAAFWAATYGLEALARAATPIAVLLAVSIALVWVLLFPDMQTGHFAQTLTADWSADGWWYDAVRTTEAAVAGLLFAHVKRPRFFTTVAVPTVALTVGVFGVRLAIIGVLGNAALPCFYPYHTVVTAIQTGGVGRWDAVFVSVWIAAIFVKVALFAWAWMQAVGTVVKPPTRHAIVTVGAVLSAVMGIVISNRSQTAPSVWMGWLSAVGIGLFAVVIPLVGCWRRKRSE